MDKNSQMSRDRAYWPQKPDAEGKTSKTIACDTHGAKTSTSERHAASAQKRAPVENVVDLNAYRQRIGADPHRTQGVVSEDHDQRGAHPFILALIVGAVVSGVIAVVALILRYM